MADIDLGEGFAALGGGQARLARALGRGRSLMLASIIVLTAAGWILVSLFAAGHGAKQGFGALGPGMGILDGLLLPQGLADFCRALIGPQTLDKASALPAAAAMWSAMVFAMMLPAAAPLMITYAEIADTAAQKGERVVSLFVLAAGYLAVWLVFALAAAVVQITLGSFMAAAAPLPVMSLLFVVAGAFQFSGLKQACLAKCRRPFTFLFARWSDKAGGVFRLGLEQGMHCLGCCWALMLLMFALGAMNLIAMALLAGLMIAERTVARPDGLRVATGCLLLGSGTALAFVSIAGLIA